ncbi:TcaA second domain-containing protein [Macrococcus animalis]|uniref:TcaA second domain-containing protein n=1 Tax=Macrococcus animalis TaxID=3395467 RepID=UPI0039BDA496
MTNCINCGAELKENQKVCTKCGTKIEPRIENNSTPLQQVNHSTPKNKKNNKLLIIILLLIGALLITFFILKSHYSPQNQAKSISEAIKNNKPSKLSELITSDNNDKFTEDDAKSYLKYLSDTDNKTRVVNEINDATKNMSTFNDSHNEIYIGGEEVLNVYRDGKVLGLFDKIAFQIPKKDVNLYTEDTGQIEFNVNGKKRTVDVNENQDNNIGQFYLGNQELKAKKTVNDETFDGLILINMNESTDAQEKFDIAYLTVDIDNDYLVDDIKLYINKKEVQYDFSNEYGPFEKGKEIEVYATATVEKKAIESSKVKVKLNSDDNSTHIMFDEDEIDQINEDTTDAEIKSIEDESKSEDDDSDNSESQDVTVDNAIDIVESFEGESLDTDQYTYKTPEENDKGVGFSYLDEDGDLAGSYQILNDGTVIKYDENGDEIDRGSGM